MSETPREPDRFDKQAEELDLSGTQRARVAAALRAAEAEALERALAEVPRTYADTLDRIRALIPPAAAHESQRDTPCGGCGHPLWWHQWSSKEHRFCSKPLNERDFCRCKNYQEPAAAPAEIRCPHGKGNEPCDVCDSPEPFQSKWGTCSRHWGGPHPRNEGTLGCVDWRPIAPEPAAAPAAEKWKAMVRCPHGAEGNETCAECDLDITPSEPAAPAHNSPNSDPVRSREPEPAAPAPPDPCQRCGKLGGHPVDFRFDSMLTGRWICPHCLDAQEKRLDAAEALLRECEEALLQEHGPRYHEPECYLCALRRKLAARTSTAGAGEGKP